MSSADGAERLLEAAVALGTARGVNALAIQAIADAAGVSKALVLYHHADKQRLFRALHSHLGAASVRRISAAAARLDPRDPFDCWRALAREECARGEIALLSALALDQALRDRGAGSVAVASLARDRERAATELVEAMLKALDLTPRIDPPLLGRMLLRHLDGIAIAPREIDPATALDAGLDAELDAFALAVLGLGK